ncbi:Gfo/Idh/MocA family protein [Microlunatus sp. GCM10028923]|uniref:Gfo/Idh/MocA family protein n=1 Tax=Microlunatus sp. GCM10028923 TaxID=3273400 RepID=UPI003612FF0D
MITQGPSAGSGHVSGPYKIIQVGLGQWGVSWGTKVVPSLGDVEVVGWVDRSEQARTAFRDLTGVAESSLHGTLTEALAANPDCRIVLAPVAWPAHYAVAQEALAAGCHLLLEKPLTVDAGQAAELAELAEARGVVFAIDQNYRWGAAVPVVRESIRSGRLGRLRSVSVRWHRDHGGVRSHALIELAIHHLDLARHLFDANGRSVTCVPHTPLADRLDPTTGADALITLESGLVINYRLSTDGTGPTTGWPGRWTISGDGALLTWGEDTFDGEPDAQCVTLTAPDGMITRLPVPERTGPGDRAGVLREFLDAADGRGTPTSPAADNRHSVALLDALLTSAASGRTESVAGSRS